MQELNDHELIDRALNGDKAAFGILVDRYKKKIYYLAYRMTRDHDCADELAQESFVKAYQALGTFKRGYSFYTWVYRICINITINFIKREKFSVPMDSLNETEIRENTAIDNNQLERLISSEQASLVRKTLDTLPPEQKAAFLLKTYDDLSYEQIAETMGTSIGTVMSRLFRARFRIKQALKDIESKRDVWDE